MANPLVAETKDSTKAYSGVSLLESAADLKSAIESGDWASVAMGAVGTALDALSMAMDPFGAVLAAGVGWLMEHVGPLKEALNGLTGNADEIAAQSETWKNIATELGSIGEDLTGMVKADTVSWTGNAADTYRQRADDTVTLLNTAQKGCEGASSGVKTAGEVVAAVRALVRDIIAELIGHLISWALQVVFTLGIGLTWVVPQVINAVAKTASKIADLVKRLVTALKALVPLLKRAGDLFSDAAKALRNIKPGKAAPPPKSIDIKGNPKDIGGPKGNGSPDAPPPKGDGTTPSGAKGDGTTPSGGKGGPDAPPKTDPPPASKGPDDTPKSPDPSPNSSTTPSGAGKGGGDKGPGSSNKPDNPRDRGVGPDDRVCKSDPVDVANGDVILEQRDLELTDPLPLVLDRTHISSYRAGQWFGPTWTSTVDQRLELDGEHVCYFSADGLILVYPHAAAGVPVLPLEGPRRPLTRTGTGYSLYDPLTRRTLTFAPLPGQGDALQPVQRVEDVSGSSISVAYTPMGAPSRLSHSAGYEVELTTDRGRVVAVEVLDGDTGFRVRATRYDYDARGRLVAIFDSSETAVRFEYDAAGRITGWQDRNDVWYRYLYDVDGRCVVTVGDGGFLDGRFAYDPARRVTTFTDSLGHRTEHHFNHLGQLVREVDPLGAVTSSTWDRYDRQQSRTDALGRTTLFEHDEDGDLRAVVRPDGSRVAVTRHLDGALDITVEAAGRIWRRTYPAGSAPDPYTTQLGVSDGSAATAAEEEPAAPGTAAVTAAHARERGTDTDLFGRPKAVLDVVGGRNQLRWSVEGKLLARTNPAGAQEQWRYDWQGNELGHTGLLGQAEVREYGPFDLLTAVTDATGARTSYTYDTELRLVAVTNPAGLTWHYTYDPAGRLAAESDFDGRVSRYAHDPAGRLVRSESAGLVVEYTYDALGNVVSRRTADELTTFGHDPVGRLAAAANAESRVDIERDEQGRVLAHTVDGRTISFGYDDENHLVRRRTPSGVDSVWRFDPDGVPLALETAGQSIHFGHDGAAETRRVFGDVVLDQAYAGERLTAQTVSVAGRPVHTRGYDYRPDGELAGIDDNTTGPVRYQLDAAGRVTAVTGPNCAEQYRYDGAGNITGTARERRFYTGTRLTTSDTAAYEYDPQGRLVARRTPDGVWHYTWNALGRLTGVVTPDGSQWRYRYDPLGRRTAKQRIVAGAPGGAPVVAEEVLFTWDGTTLVEEQAGARVTTWEYHPDDGKPLAQLASGRLATVVTDQVGAPVELVDAAGALLWRGQADLWGADTADPSGTPLRFPGQYRDAETGLHYNVYRYYDPATGRYLSPDPLGLEPAPNPVAYVPNPLLAADPLGLAPTVAPCGKIINDGPPKRKRSEDDSTGASGSGSNKRPNTGKNYKPGDIVNDDLKDPAIDKYKNFPPAPEGAGKGFKDAEGKSKIKRSEDVGEAGAHDYLKKVTGKDDLQMITPTKDNPLEAGKYGKEPGKPWPNAVAFNGRNVADVSYWDGKTMHVVEAKGNGSTLSGGMTGRTQRFDPSDGSPVPQADRPVDVKLNQGDEDYLKDVAANMKHTQPTAKSYDGRAEVGTAIWDSIKDGNYKYVPVNTTVGPDGKAVVKVTPGYGE
ncbi:RHS repeat-associated core domain-containing protein [Amycolatopsis sp. NPDC051758]|uniref:RHS repeat-associated core domain-containing protein n=1 Tax=Amycolatopsis sp. NPDC051758 TaxID=3363935 RepID=UPI0037AEAB7B